VNESQLIFPNELYKFTSIDKEDNLINSLEEGYLWLSKPKDFNDPYDCYEKLVTVNPTDDLIKRAVNSGMKNSDRTEKRRWMKSAKKNRAEFKKKMEGSVAELYGNIGVCCFTQNNYTDILMWSHYGDNHKGVCLKFDISLSPKEFAPILEVKYTPNFKAIDYDFESAKSMEHYVTTKSKVWEYENEVRKVRLLSQEPSQKFNFPPESLTEIAFGCDTPYADALKVYNIIHKKYPHVKVHHMKMEESKFELKPIEGYLY